MNSNIYIFTNKINGKVYVGQSIYPESRKIQHINASKTKDYLFYRALRKYGIENFEFQVIEKDIHVDKIGERERYWIKKLNSKAPNGYNSTDGGEGCPGMKYTIEARDKMSKSAKARCNYGVFPQQFSSWVYGDSPKRHTPLPAEVKKAISEKRKGTKTSEETKKKISKALKGKPKSEHQKQAVKAFNKKLPECKKQEIVQRLQDGLKRSNYNPTEHFFEMSECDKKEMYAKISRSNKRCIPIIGIDLKTGESIRFHSIHEASRFIGDKFKDGNKNRTPTIRKAISRNGTAYGYKWEKQQ